MSLLDDLTVGAESVRRERPTHPSGWEPGIAWDGTTGTITSRPLAEPTPNWDALLVAWGFDPAMVEVVEPVQVRTWDAAIGDGNVRTMWYYRAGVRQRRKDAPDVAELVTEIRRHRPAKRPAATGSGRAFVYVASDWQTGKERTAGMVKRVLASYDRAAARLRMLRRTGVEIDTVYMVSLGDLVEGCRDHYAQQSFTVELDKRSQVKLARRLWIKGVETLAPLADRMVCGGVGGNHGEERRDGKSYTTFADNADVEVIEQAAEVLTASPAYRHVSHVIPHEQLTLTLDMAGTIVGLAHGHQARRGGTTAQAKVRDWWKNQAFGMRPVGDSTLLLTGHYHHFSVVQDGPRTHLQAPTMDGGSQWWEEAAGMPTVPAALTFTVGPDGWDDIKLL